MFCPDCHQFCKNKKSLRNHKYTKHRVQPAPVFMFNNMDDNDSNDAISHVSDSVDIDSHEIVVENHDFQP